MLYCPVCGVELDTRLIGSHGILLPEAICEIACMVCGSLLIKRPDRADFVVRAANGGVWIRYTRVTDPAGVCECGVFLTNTRSNILQNHIRQETENPAVVSYYISARPPNGARILAYSPGSHGWASLTFVLTRYVSHRLDMIGLQSLPADTVENNNQVESTRNYSHF